MSSTLEKQIQHRILLAVQATPDDIDLDSFTEFAVKHREQFRAVFLIIVPGSKRMTDRQRKRFVEKVQPIFQREEIPVAILTAEYDTKIVVGIISWTVKWICGKAFPPFRIREEDTNRPSSLVTPLGWIVKRLTQTKIGDERASITAEYLNPETIDSLDRHIATMYQRVVNHVQR